MKLTLNEAKEMIKMHDAKGITPKKLQEGFLVELEHNKGKFNVTKNNKHIISMIALAHLTEHKDYYKILKKAGL